jgi:hypothetical protein
LSILAGRRAAVIALAIGVITAGAGAAGLALTRHPVATRWDTVAALPAPTLPAPTLPAPTLPAPTGPVVPVRRSPATEVARPVTLTIPSIGVQAPLVTLGLTASGALHVPSSTAVAGWYTAHRLPGRPGSLLPAITIAP